MPSAVTVNVVLLPSPTSRLAGGSVILTGTSTVSRAFVVAMPSALLTITE